MNSLSNTEKNICRLCSEPSTLHFSLFENDAEHMLETLTAIKIRTDDPFTTRICLDCFSDLKNAYKIQQKIIQNQKKFLESVGSSSVRENVNSDIFIDMGTKLNSPGMIKNEVKMEVDLIEELFDNDYCESENSNLIAEMDYGHIEGDESGTSITSTLVPGKSKGKYETAYSRFDEWCIERKIENINEKVLLTYFNEKSSIQKPSSLWCNYSILKTMLSIRKNIDISKYKNVLAFLKSKSEGYKTKKSRVFTMEEFIKFLKEADDARFLMMKVALIIGVAGACRREELTYLLTDNLKDEGDSIRIHLPDTKTKTRREFVVTSGNFDTLNLIQTVRKYINLRPANAGHNRFFVSYRNEKCTKQPVGINTFGAMPKNIATFLGLPNPEQYTGHCFRRSSTSLLANNGADILTLRRVKTTFL